LRSFEDLRSNFLMRSYGLFVVLEVGPATKSGVIRNGRELPCFVVGVDRLRTRSPVCRDDLGQATISMVLYVVSHSEPSGSRVRVVEAFRQDCIPTQSSICCHLAIVFFDARLAGPCSPAFSRSDTRVLWPRTEGLAFVPGNSKREHGSPKRTLATGRTPE